MSEILSIDNLATSFGAFKPVGHVMVGLPRADQAQALTAALLAAGWQSTAVLPFSPTQTAAEFEEMAQDADSAGSLAGFGYEVTLLRRYLKLTREGYRWLLVKVDSTEHAARAAEIARAYGATLAVHYRMLIVEELI